MTTRISILFGTIGFGAMKVPKRVRAQGRLTEHDATTVHLGAANATNRTERDVQLARHSHCNASFSHAVTYRRELGSKSPPSQSLGQSWTIS
jgi:hypothetical protein